MRRLVGILLRLALGLVLVLAIGVGGGLAWLFSHYGRDLPDYQQLATYLPATGSKVYAGDGTLMAEYATEKRVIVPIGAIPPRIIHAFLAAEDREFYSHNGVNPLAVARAAIADIVRYRRGQRPIGASTITQQIVKHFLLNNEVSLARKIKEAILAYRIERYLSKDRILEIYLNEIYLGAGAYGVGAAADTYFQKPLDQLTLAQAAFLGALPKAPNNYNPQRYPQAAKARRDWVLAGMAEKGWITPGDARAATAEPIDAHPRLEPDAGPTGYFAEEVRRELIARLGDKLVYQGGLIVRTSYVPVYQAMAERAFRAGLVDYDRRHGWRGPLAHLPDGGTAAAALSGMPDPPGSAPWLLAAVVAIDSGGAQIAVRYGGPGRIPLEELRWARRTLDDQRIGGAVRSAHDVLAPGDIVLVEPLAASARPGTRYAPATASYGLRQIPDVSGGVVVMDPKTGRVFALAGGWDFQASQFDRATQARRQPGSAIKPFVYVTALERDFTPASVIQDAPLELDQGPGLPKWRPVNYEGSFVGPTTLYQALVHSRNLATARLATMIGLPAIARTVEKFGIMDKMPLYYSMALGAGETTLLRLTSAYAMLGNGGHRLLPSIIDLVQDRDGRILYQKGVGACQTCYVQGGPHAAPETSALYRSAGSAATAASFVPNAQFAPNALVYKPIAPDELVDPIADAQIVAMMQGVVQQGTGIKVAAVGKPLAGKTGTSSDWYDGWFVGFSPDLAAGVYVGFDTPRTLGDGETGGNVAAPIFRDFMAEALKGAPALSFAPPTGATLVTVNTIAGTPGPGDRSAVTLPFRPGTEPKVAPPPSDELLGADEQPAAAYAIPTRSAPASGTGGLY
ncbi:MAG: PBP1A family penicillin-binding protein [Alphaproteobacteria bacterium]|nr:PBP1A family penicillin-binding protein [Alphaproteobacteria bacterium]